MFHVLSLNVRLDGLAVASSPPPLITTVTLAVGRVTSLTVNVSAPLGSLVDTTVFDSARPASSSAFVTDTSVGVSAWYRESPGVPVLLGLSLTTHV